MGWVDYKRAFDMVPHSWILKCLDIFKVADNVKKLLRQSMLNWETELTSGNERLGTVKIKRGIFQGDSLSPLLFVLALMPLSMILRKVKAAYEFRKGSPVINHLLYMDDLKLFGKTERHLETLLSTVGIFSQDIRMEFGISKCGILILKRGKLVHLEGTEIPSGKRIKEIDTDQGYKYLGILEADDMKFSEMKSTIKKEYLRRLKVILKSNLNSKNTISAINSRAISIVKYSAGILGWTVSEIKELDRKTRKMLTLHNMFHKKSDVDRLYISRQEGGRGLISIEDCVLMERNNLFHYVNESREQFLREVVKEEVVSEGMPKVEIRKRRKESLMNKNLHSVFFVKTDFRDSRSWEWLKNGDLKKATEGTIMAAQEQATRTRSIRHRIDKENVSPLCRLCGEREETVAHVVSECKVLAQSQYKKWRHDTICQIIHWQLCKDNGLDHSERWYDHRPDAITENESVKLLWDMQIQTDKVLEHSRPDIVLMNKGKRSAKIIDIACSFDTRVVEKEQETIAKYQDLKWELNRIWNCREFETLYFFQTIQKEEDDIYVFY